MTLDDLLEKQAIEELIASYNHAIDSPQMPFTGVYEDLLVKQDGR